MKKYGKISKGVLITIIILVCVLTLAIVGFFGYITFNKINKEKQEKMLADEVTSMYTSQEVNTEIKTNGKFADVEGALKTYYTEYVNTSKELLDIYSQNILNNSLTANNISSDGPEFTNTKANINKIKSIEANTINKYEELISDEYVNNKAKELNLNDYYTNLFISEINDTLKVKEDVAKIKTVTEEYDKWMSKIEEILNFLTENKSSWKVSGSNIMFTSQSLVEKYNSLLTSLRTQESLLKMKLNTIQ